MALRVRIPPSIVRLPAAELTIERAPPDIGSLLRELDVLHPGLAKLLDSSAVNAAVNGDVVLHGRDATALADGDEVEFLLMFAGG